MKFLNGFYFSKKDIREMLENINDILSSYRDDNNIILGVMNPEEIKYYKISEDVNYSLLKSKVFDYNFHNEVKIVIILRDDKWFPKTKIVGDDLDILKNIIKRLNNEYHSLFQCVTSKYTRIESCKIKYK